MPRITELASLTVPNSTDPLAIVDTSGAITKKITRDDLIGGAPLPAGSIDTQALDDAAVTPAKIEGIDKSLLTTDSNPYKFSAYKTSSQSVSASTTSTVVFNQENFDTNSNFNQTTGQYTVPVSGFMMFSSNVGATLDGGNVYSIVLTVNNAATHRGSGVITGSGTAIQYFNISVLLQVTAGQTIAIAFTNGSAGAKAISNTQANTYFTGYLVSRT